MAQEARSQADTVAAARPRIRLLADDLTGALDTAMDFSGEGGARISWGAERDDGAMGRCLDIRDGPVTDAQRMVTDAAAWLCDARVALLKCDSRLRGHVAASLTAALAAVAPVRVVVAPAFPEQGRVMRSGRLWTSSPAGYQREPCNLMADLAALGSAATLSKPGTETPLGISIWDTETDADLDEIVLRGMRAEARDGGRTLWCGSAGLASALARFLGNASPKSPSLSGPALMLIGTAHPVTRSQLAHVRTHCCAVVVAISPSGHGVEAVAARLKHGEHAIAVADPHPHGDYNQINRDVSAALRCVLDAVPRPATLFVTGGSTLLGVTARLKAVALNVDGAFAPGVPTSRLIGGRWHGLRLVSKSGGFGTDSFFSDLIAACDQS